MNNGDIGSMLEELKGAKDTAKRANDETNVQINSDLSIHQLSQRDNEQKSLPELIQLNTGATTVSKDSTDDTGENMWDHNSQVALDYMSMQWPSDFPPDKKPPPPPKKVDAEKVEADERQKLLDYAQKVTQEATDERDAILQAEKDKEEEKVISQMGKPGVEVTLQLDSNIEKFDEDA